MLCFANVANSLVFYILPILMYIMAVLQREKTEKKEITILPVKELEKCLDIQHERRTDLYG